MFTSHNDKIFKKLDSTSNLQEKSIKGGFLTVIGQGGVFVSKLLSTAVLARILSPEDFGLVAMTVVIVGFVAVFKDAGLASATIQKNDVNHAQISTLFWINVALGCCTAILLASLSSLVADIYGKSELVWITLILSLNFVFGGLTVQHLALLRRLMRFKAVALLEMAAVVFGIAVGLSMAFFDWGYWSLVAITLGTSFFRMIGVWLILRWIPGLPRRRTGVRGMLKFGGDVLAFQVVNYFGRNMDNFLIGWKWGPISLGIYEKAYSLLLMPVSQINTPLTAVIIPTLSRARNDLDEYKRLLLGALQITFYFTVPSLIFLAVFSKQVVLLWLGESWMQSAELFRALFFAAVIGAVLNTTGWTFLSLGNTKSYRTIGVINAILMVTAFFIGLPYGAEGVAWAYSLVMLVIFIPTWYMSLKGSGVSLREVLNTFITPVLSSIPGAALGWSIAEINEDVFGNFWLNSFLGVMVFFAMYCLIVLVFLRKWTELLSVLRELKSNKE